MFDILAADPELQAPSENSKRSNAGVEQNLSLAHVRADSHLPRFSEPRHTHSFKIIQNAQNAACIFNAGWVENMRNERVRYRSRSTG